MAAREKYIRRTQQLLERRGRLMEKLEQEGSRADEEHPETRQRYTEEIGRMNEEINEEMNAKRFTIRGEYNRTKNRRVTGRKYKNPYEGPTVDGLFFDKKN